MKKILLLTAFVALFLTACSKDDDTPQNFPVTNTGTMSVDGQLKSINNAFVVKPYTGNSPDYDKRRFFLMLTNGEVSVFNNDFVFSDSTTQLVSFNLYTDAGNPAAIQSTTYGLFVPDSGFDTQDAFIDQSSVNTNISIQSGEFISGDSLDTDAELNAGQLTLVQSNGLYTITFSFSGNGHEVNGQYSGTINDLNMTWE